MLKIPNIALKFCEEINNEKPFFIKTIKNSDEFKSNNCFLNVSKKISSSGGKALYGWKITPPSITIKAVAHCVWLSPDNTIIDITPDVFFNPILFLPDKNLIFKGYPIKSIRKCLTNDIKIIKLYEMENELDDLKIKYWLPKIQGTAVPIEENDYYVNLQNKYQVLLSELISKK